MLNGHEFAVTGLYKPYIDFFCFLFLVHLCEVYYTFEYITKYLVVNTISCPFIPFETFVLSSSLHIFLLLSCT